MNYNLTFGDMLALNDSIISYRPVPVSLLSVGQFRGDLPEFTDPSVYPDLLVSMWMAVAVAQVQNTDRWATLLVTAQELVTAHYLVLAVRDRIAGANGGTPGTPEGLMTAQTVGPVSGSFDFTLTLSATAGQWNQTTYGTRYYALARLMGAGGIQLGGCY